MSKPRSDIAWLCRNVKAPSLLASVDRLAERARAENWSHEEFLCACLEREVSSRQTHGGENRIKAAKFPSYKTLEDFDFNHQRSVRKEVVAHLGTLDFVAAKQNVIFLGPPGTGRVTCRPLLGPGLSGRAPSGFCHRHRMGGPARRRSFASAAKRATSVGLDAAADHRRVHLPFDVERPTCSSSWSAPATSGPA